MFATLGVGEVRAIVLVYGEAEPAFEGADVIFEEVGVLVKIDGFKGEFAEAFAPVCIGTRGGGYTATAELGASPIL